MLKLHNLSKSRFIGEQLGCTIMNSRSFSIGQKLMAKKKKSSSLKKRRSIEDIFSMDPFQIIQQQGIRDGPSEDMMYFEHPILGMAPEMLKQAFVYEQEHQNHDSVAINWHEENDHFELVVTCPGLSKKRAQVSIDENCLVVKGKLKPLSGMMESVTFHRRVPLPEGAKIEAKPHITDLNVERSEYDGAEGICIMIRKQESESTNDQENFESSFGEDQEFTEETTRNSSGLKKSKKKKSKSKKKTFDDDYIIDAQFIEKCA